MSEPATALECDDALLLLARDVSTGLDAERRTRLQAHLASCPSCEQARSIVEHADDLDELPLVQPSHYIRGRVEGRGGMGRVIIARDRRLGRMVALKEILDDSLRERFEREIRVTARLDHPNIVTIHEAGRWPDGAPFFAMRWIDGESLASRLAALSTWPERAALVPYVVAAAQAIAYAHGQRVVHRDLKPGNILIGPYGETVVIDWGLAIDLEEYAADGATTGLSGTPQYMPPEQALGSPPDPRMDVYALGATLYHVITGAPPYTGSLEGVLESLLRGPPKPISAIVRDAPADLVAVASRAMEHDAARRYQDAQALADDLARFVAGQLVSVRVPPLRERLARWARRNRAALAIALLAIVAMAALGVWSIGETERASANEHAAHRAKAKTELAEHRVRRALAHEVHALLQRDDVSTRQAILDLQTDSPRMVWTTPASGAAVTKVASSANGKLVVSGHADGDVYVWSATGTRVHAYKLTGHVLAVAINDGGVVAASDKHGITIWRPGAPPLQLKPIGFAHELAIDATGTWLTAAGRYGALVLASWELHADGTARLASSDVQFRGRFHQVALRRDATLAAVVRAITKTERVLQLVDPRDGRLVLTIPEAQPTEPWFSADGTRVYQRRGMDGLRAHDVATGDEDKHLRVSGRSFADVLETREGLAGHAWMVIKDAGVTLWSPAQQVAFDRGRAATFVGNLVVIGNDDGSLHAYDLVERCVGRHIPDQAHALAFDASGRRLAIGTVHLSVWDVTGDRLAHVARPRAPGIDGLAFADDDTLVALTRDKTDPWRLEWWSLKTAHAAAPPWITALPAHEVRALTERHVLLAVDGRLVLHELSSGAIVTSMPDSEKPVRVLGDPPRIVVDRRRTMRSPTSHLDPAHAAAIDDLLDNWPYAAVSHDGTWVARGGAGGGAWLFRVDEARSVLTASPAEVAARMRPCIDPL